MQLRKCRDVSVKQLALPSFMNGRIVNPSLAYFRPSALSRKTSALVPFLSPLLAALLSSPHHCLDYRFDNPFSKIAWRHREFAILLHPALRIDRNTNSSDTCDIVELLSAKVGNTIGMFFYLDVYARRGVFSPRESVYGISKFCF